MKECTVLKLGVSSNGNNWMLVEYFEGDFAIQGFTKPRDLSKYTEGDTVQIPQVAIRVS